MATHPKAHSKFSVADIIFDHYRTLHHHGTGRPRMADYMVYLGLPLAGAALGWWVNARARNIPELLAAVAILTGLIFNVFVVLFNLPLRASEKIESADLDVINELAEQLRANVSYAVLVGISLTAFLGVAAMFSDTSQPLPTAPTLVIIFSGVQMLLTIFMVLKRVRSLFRAFRVVQPERQP